MLFDSVACEVDDYLDATNSCLVGDFVQSRVSALYAAGAFVEKLNAVIKRLRDSVHAGDTAIVGPNSVTLHQSSSAHWSIIRISSDQNTLNLVPVPMVLIKLDAADATVEEYELQSECNNEIFDSASRLTKIGQSIWRQGEIRTFTEWTRVSAIKAPDGPSSLFLSVKAANTHNYEWSFDRLSLRAINYVCIEPGYSNLRTMFELLAASGNTESKTFVRRYTKHRLHFVRWDAIATIASLDPSEGLALVSSALNDSHPEVRHAAKGTLENLSAAKR